mgnify:CR=1 FL=1
MFYIAAFILGCIWGSFSNVCIYRLPNDQSVVKGRSFCTSCKEQIKWYDNIPFLSFIFLKGKCRRCGNKISSQYFLVEFVSAISFVIVYHLYGITITTLLLIILSVFPNERFSHNIVYPKKLSFLFFVTLGSICLTDPAAAFLGVENKSRPLSFLS